MSKSLLLDFDGVLFANDKMNKIIEHRSTIYLNHHTKIPYKVASKINSKFYKQFGHTVNLVKELVEDSSTVTMEDFNDFVYSRKTLRSIKEELTLNDMELSRLWGYTIQEYIDSGYSVKIFSNAPLVWIEECLFTLSNDMLSFDDITCFDNLSRLKPDIHSYLETYKNENRIIFVDDSIDNLKPIQGDDVWIPVLFGNAIVSDMCFTTDNPLHLKKFI